MGMKHGEECLLIVTGETKTNNGQRQTQTSHNFIPFKLETWKIKYSWTSIYSDSTMRGLTLTLTWTPIILVLVILVTSPFPTQAQSRDRTITKAQVEEIVKNFKPGRSQLSEGSPERKLERLLNCTQGVQEKCDGRKKSLVIRELLLRRQIRDMGEACTSDEKGNTALYAPPYRPISQFIPTEAYEEWQDKLLDTGLTFCNPTKHLTCSPNSKKCECRPGTVLNPEVDQDKCSAIIGGYCWITGVKLPEQRVALYDPIGFNFRGQLVILESQCRVTGDSFCQRDLKLFLNNTCTDGLFRDLDQKLENQFKDLPRLNFGDPCNLEHQTQLYTTTEAEVRNYTIRVKNLEAILAAKTPFCDRKRFIMCGSGGKCDECIKPTTYNPEIKSCTFKNPHNACQRTAFEEMTAAFPGSVAKEVMEGFETARDRDCPFNCSQAKFPNGKLVMPTFSFCPTCPEVPKDVRGLIQLVGTKCDKALTLFLEGAPPPSLPIDIPEYEKQLELFVQFNEKAKEFEKLFRLAKNSPCDYAGELEAYRSIRRIRNVEFPDKVFTEQNYKDLIISMDKLIAQFGGRGLCLYRFRGTRLSFGTPPYNRPLMLCGPTPDNSICYELNNTVYFEELVKRLSEKSFQATPGGNCAPHPRDIIKYAGDKFRTNKPSPPKDPLGLNSETPDGINAYEYVFDTLENHWIENSKFCNRKGGDRCTKSVDDKSNATGKCEFSKAYLDEVNAEEAERLAKLGIDSKSSHSSIHHFFPTFLFILYIIILN